MTKTVCRGSFFYCTVLILSSFLVFKEGHAQKNIVWNSADKKWRLDWDVESDKAGVKDLASGAVLWQGSLMPSFWLQTSGGKAYVKAGIKPGYSVSPGTSQLIPIVLPAFGEGVLKVNSAFWGLEIESLEINWKTKAPAIIEMYFGTSKMDTSAAAVMPVWDRPFMPDWRAGNYCIPGAKEGPVQSYFRMWDFGNTTISLGSFATSIGAPYGAAFPRPTLFASMGMEKGFVTIGAGELPDAAFGLTLAATSSCIQLLYREDLWGAQTSSKRVWKNPLRLTVGEDAYSSIRQYFSSFSKPNRTASVDSVASVWNTWGMWKDRKYPIRPIAELADSLHSGMVVLDDPWEDSQGSGTPSLKRFPQFNEDISFIRSKGMQVGIWETVAWIADPFSAGLTNQDLILNKYGKPAKGNWAFNPWGEGYYCLDISSAKTRAFITERTIRIMKAIRPSLIKLDFGYGLPDPNMGVPADPAYRGEKYSFELLKLIYAAAKSVDPKVAIMYYSINPMYLPYTDVVSMDDQGDLGYDVKGGHAEWSVWASLLADWNTVVSGSSSYSWVDDDEVILNSFVLGHPGSVLPSHLDNNPVPLKFLNRRYAINTWYRKTRNWQPLWLNSTTGNPNQPPVLNCWGRMENGRLTAVSLRTSPEPYAPKELKEMQWQGRWSVVSQTGADLFSTNALVVVPYDAGWISIPMNAKPSSVNGEGIGAKKSTINWTWKNGILKIEVTGKELDNVAGIVIRKMQDLVVNHKPIS
ncbi:hypothetical protein [Pollutibacter soli]|uniref:hypothetical protein n=1 Tax=Pollutibacter soli TaxID=3034157 RepID=UPI003014045F